MSTHAMSGQANLDPLFVHRPSSNNCLTLIFHIFRRSLTLRLQQTLKGIRIQWKDYQQGQTATTSASPSPYLHSHPLSDMCVHLSCNKQMPLLQFQFDTTLLISYSASFFFCYLTTESLWMWSYWFVLCGCFLLPGSKATALECLEAMACGLYSELFTLIISLINRLVLSWNVILTFT